MEEYIVTIQVMRKSNNLTCQPKDQKQISKSLIIFLCCCSCYQTKYSRKNFSLVMSMYRAFKSNPHTFFAIVDKASYDKLLCTVCLGKDCKQAYIGQVHYTWLFNFQEDFVIYHFPFLHRPAMYVSPLRTKMMNAKKRARIVSFFAPFGAVPSQKRSTELTNIQTILHTWPMESISRVLHEYRVH